MHGNICSPLTSSLAAACLAFASFAATAAPARAEIAWEISRNGSAVGEVLDSLEQDGNSYRITSTTRGRGLLSLAGDVRRSSRGTIVAGALRPGEFEDARTGRDPARASFDWSSHTLTQQSKGQSQTTALPADAYDRLTQLYGFAFRAPPDGLIPMNVADGRGVSAYTFQVVGRETLKLPTGDVETLKVAKRKDQPGDRSTEIWLAIKQHLLPVRVLVVEKDGTRIDQVATRVSVQ